MQQARSSSSFLTLSNDENEQLKKAELEIAWTDAERVYVTEGVETGDRLVTSPMSNPMNGSLVEVIE